MCATDEIEWDSEKDMANRAKHGLPLAFASFVFDGRPRFERSSPQRGRRAGQERRIEAIAELEGRVILRLRLAGHKAPHYFPAKSSSERTSCL